MRMGFLIWLFVLPLSLQADNDFEREQIQQRITPVGQVRLQEEGSSNAVQVVSQEVKQQTEKEAPGQAVYEQYCQLCHRDGLAGAPKFRLEVDWQPRLDTKDIDALTEVVMKGLNAMPPKGTCLECNEEYLKAAVEYMVPRS